MTTYDWQILISQFEHEIGRSRYSGGTPAPGASEAQIVAAEQRLCVALDPCYREFLAFVNGWDSFTSGGRDLFAVDELGVSDRWKENKEALAEWDSHYNESIVPQGMPPWEDMLVVGGYGFSLGSSCVLLPAVRRTVVSPPSPESCTCGTTFTPICNMNSSPGKRSKR